MVTLDVLGGLSHTHLGAGGLTFEWTGDDTMMMWTRVTQIIIRNKNSQGVGGNWYGSLLLVTWKVK